MAKDIEFKIDDYDGKHHDLEADISDDEVKVDIDYQNFNRPGDFDVDEDYLEEEYSPENLDNHYKDDLSALDSLSTIFKWFGIIGMIIAFILVIYFISRGKILGLILYLLLLVGSYFLGYFLMSLYVSNFYKQ
jgi:hypothetical protein